MDILRYQTEVAGIVTTSIIQIFKGVYAKDSETINNVLIFTEIMWTLVLMYKFSAEAFIMQFFLCLQLSVIEKIFVLVCLFVS